MDHFSATKHHRDLDLVPFHQELAGVVELKVEIVLIRPGTKLHLFEGRRVGLLARTLFLLLILELAVVHDPANRGTRRRRNLDEVETFVARNDQRFLRRHDAQLFAISPDHSDFTDTNTFVDPGRITLRGYDSKLRSSRYLIVLLRRMV